MVHVSSSWAPCFPVCWLLFFVAAAGVAAAAAGAARVGSDAGVAGTPDRAPLQLLCSCSDMHAARVQVFDDWKVARDDWLAAQQQHQPNNDRAAAAAAAPSAALGRGAKPASGAAASGSGSGTEAAAALPAPAPAAARYPKLSNVSLAFLEACCRSEPDCEWRVYDVCAVMRQQKELKRQAGLARPQKQSHHFAPA